MIRHAPKTHPATARRLRRTWLPSTWLMARRIERIWALGERLPAPQAGPRPSLSFVVPVFNADPRHLSDLLRSFRAQPAGCAELIFSDDGSERAETLVWLETASDLPGVKVLQSPENRGIARATNAAIDAADADWIGLVDQDDLIAPGAVKAILGALADVPSTVFLYTDEAIAGPRLEARGLYLKPGFDPVLLAGVNYINHLSVYRRDRLRGLGSLGDGFNGSQDYDLVLRYSDGLRREQITHLPYPAYVWRQHRQSLSHTRLTAASAGARKALRLHHQRRGGEVTVGPAPMLPNLHRVDFRARDDDWPRVSVILPNRDAYELIETCLRGLLFKTNYPALEVILVDNGSTDARVLALYDRLAAQDRRLRVDITPAPFNFSRMINRGAALASGAHFLLLNNDIEITDPDWLQEMVGCLAFPGSGIVGAKLLFPNGSLQHAGVILGARDHASHWYYKAPGDLTGPMGRLAVRNSMTAVTGAAMLISGPCWRTTGPFDEARFRVAYNDVDFCARARALGWGVVWTPHATLIHHESASRGQDKSAAHRARFKAERAALRDAHDTPWFEDPVRNPWISRKSTAYRMAWRSDLPAPRHFMGHVAEPRPQPPDKGEDRPDGRA